MLYNEMSRDELVSLKNELEKKYEEVKSLGLSHISFQVHF